MSNLRYALRGLARSPLFTLTAVVSLALGIGANTAIFSILDRVLLRALPVKSPDELVFLYHPGPVQGSSSTDEPNGPSFSYPMFRNLQQQATPPFAGLAGTRSAAVSVSWNGQAVSGLAHLVSGNYFSLLGVSPALGRLLTEDDDRVVGGHPIAVLGHAYWTSRLGADVSVLNRPLIVNGHALTIVGVTQKGFGSEVLGRVPDVFLPITMKRAMTPDWDGLADRRDYWVTLFARLAPGVGRDHAEAAINAAYRGELEQDVALLRNAAPDFLKRFRAKRILLTPGEGGRGTLRASRRTPLLLLLGMTLLVLLIACANVANLQLVRAAARTREIAVRLALGASRRQLIGQLLTESMALAIGSGIVGLLVAYVTLRGITALLPAQPPGSNIISTSLDARVLLAALAASIVTGLVFGLYPALHGSTTNVLSSLKDQSGQMTSGRAARFVRKSLVTLQTAISLLLLVAAGLLGRTLVNLTHVDLGIRVDHLVTFSVDPKLNRYDDARTRQFYDALTERLSAIPGVTLVSAARVPAVAGSSSSRDIAIEGGSRAAESNFNNVGADYFRALGIPLVVGREFSQRDDTAAPKVAVVNEAFARKFFPGQNPIGRRISEDSGERAQFDVTVVGVVKDARYSSMREPPPPVYYVPYRQSPRMRSIFFYVRTGVDPEQVIAGVHRAVAALDPDLPLRFVRTMEAQIDNNVANERLLSALTGTFAGLATLLAGIGLYGVLAFNVARRTREIGIRMALGATARQVQRLVVSDAAVVLAIGVAAGLGAAVVVARLIRGVLYGLTPLDPTVFGSAVLILGAIALGAAYLPSRRATKVDPMTALRQD